MKIVVKILISLIAFLCSIFTNAQILNTEVKAKIEISSFEDLVAITGTAENLTSVLQNLHYKLSVIKKNKTNSNISSNSQNGSFTLEPNSKNILSTTKINISSKDETIILLLIYDEDEKLIGKDRLVVDNMKNKTTEEKEIGLEMKGIISDETKTKIGKDYYDLFFKKYNLENINASKIVTIEEEQLFGRTTKIKILIDNITLNEFIAKPNEEFLESMAEQSIVLTKKYLKQLELNEKLISQY
ncbi:MAG: curli production assembly/transport protein CsgE [Flavobacterium sp.]|nr:curli production assembly/transport protein CsgE [Flavobacterium sp.]